MNSQNYYTIFDIAKRLNIPEAKIAELTEDYHIILRRVSEDSQIKFHESSIDMFRYVIEQSKKGVDKQDIIKSLGFDPAFLCNKDKAFCQ